MERLFEHSDWALILGGSSGFGLATAKKLAKHGMNLFILHRDRRGAMARIEPEFEALRLSGVEVVTRNADALRADGREAIFEAVAKALGDRGRVKLLLHSIAFGNLKLIAPEIERTDRTATLAALAKGLGVDASAVQQCIDELFVEGSDALQGMATPPTYSSDSLLEDDDLERTVFAMGTSLLSWTQGVHARGLFSEDARVLGLTSEGNSVAWKGYAAVAAAKCALESISRAIATEMAPHGIRSNVVQAGVTNTRALQLIPGNAHLMAQARSRNPMGRLTRPEDVADVIYLLCLRESAWINGEVIRVDGGEHISGVVG